MCLFRVDLFLSLLPFQKSNSQLATLSPLVKKITAQVVKVTMILTQAHSGAVLNGKMMRRLRKEKRKMNVLIFPALAHGQGPLV
ncbi:hypothetical protein BC835DRAFT_1338393 [Cytidiella melzeri]|nr:hypothetical protein BC835DRAFT_1338393 [Cytidiella melzeri]